MPFPANMKRRIFPFFIFELGSLGMYTLAYPVSFFRYVVLNSSWSRCGYVLRKGKESRRLRLREAEVAKVLPSSSRVDTTPYFGCFFFVFFLLFYFFIPTVRKRKEFFFSFFFHGVVWDFDERQVWIIWQARAEPQMTAPSRRSYSTLSCARSCFTLNDGLFCGLGDGWR